eukprot:gb/GECG01016650.1/.p1 GENE.gb/GECG01016650.1/~~gb/GECG01016650.1/.p1  ORF type:complete len:284 (+),score=40.12 gb/GECG01016650.1/:1-852(+)
MNSSFSSADRQQQYGTGTMGGSVGEFLGSGENIYNWIKREEPPAQKLPMYRSKYNPTNPPVRSTFNNVTQKKPNGTIGRITKDQIQPKQYLKAHERTGAAMPDKTKPKRFQRQHERRKPSIPKRDEQPPHGLRSDKNYVVGNAVENILAAPGGRHRGEPDYLHKADYGKVPAYLDDVKKEVEAEREMIQQILDEDEMKHEEGPRYREMSEEERDELLNALKTKWDLVNHEYQKMTWKNISTTNSTFGQIQAKEDCENQLAQLEKDIERLSAKGPIYVLDEDQS